MHDIEKVQAALSQALDTVGKLGRIASEAVTEAEAREGDLAKVRGAYDMAAESRFLWKRRAIQAGWAPPVSLLDWATVEHQARPEEPWNPSAQPEEVITLSGAVGQALGTASMCWSDVSRAGTFQDGKALWVHEGLVAWLSDWADEQRKQANEATAAKMLVLVKEWADLAYEMYALLCASSPGEHSTDAGAAEWRTAFNRLKDRFHQSLATLPESDRQQPEA